MSVATTAGGVRLVLPATSANLGPGFDAAGLAMSMHLSVEAHAASSFEIHATGRDAELCGTLVAARFILGLAESGSRQVGHIWIPPRISGIRVMQPDVRPPARH